MAGEELLIDYGTAWEDQWRMFERDTKMWYKLLLFVLSYVSSMFEILND